MSLPVLSGQLLVGLINGSFYAVLSLGLSIIFGLLGIVNLTQGAFYMVGAFFAWMLLQLLGIGYWGGPWFYPPYYGDWVTYWGPSYYPARPSTEVLADTGLPGPLPSAVTRSCGMPLLTR